MIGYIWHDFQLPNLLIEDFKEEGHFEPNPVLQFSKKFSLGRVKLTINLSPNQQSVHSLNNHNSLQKS